jgi:hypothetical protein
MVLLPQAEPDFIIVPSLEVLRHFGSRSSLLHRAKQIPASGTIC